IALLLALAALLLVVHGKWTWRLRERRLMQAVHEAAHVDWTRWRFIVNEPRTGEALFLIGVRPYDPGKPLEGTYKELWTRGQDDTAFLPRLLDEYREHPVPTVVIL